MALDLVLVLAGLAIIAVSAARVVRGARPGFLNMLLPVVSAGLLAVSWSIPGFYTSLFILAPVALGLSIRMLRDSSIVGYAALAVVYASCMLAPGVLEFDPRGGLLLPILLQVALVASLVSSVEGLVGSIAGVIYSLLLAPLSWFMVFHTRTLWTIPLDPLGVAILGYTLLYASRLDVEARISASTAPAATLAMLATRGFYVRHTDVAYLAPALLAASAVVAYRVYRGSARLVDVKPLGAYVAALALSVAREPAAAAALLLASPVVASRLYTGVASVAASLLIAPIAPSLAPLPAALTLAYHGVRSRLGALASAGVGVVTLVLLAAALSTCVQLEATVEAVGLGALEPVRPPTTDMVHYFYALYLGVKNETIGYVYTLNALAKMGVAPEEAKRIAYQNYIFYRAIREAAEERGVHDPYPITQLQHPEMLPSLEARLCVGSLCTGYRVPPQALLSGTGFEDGMVYAAGLSLLRVCRVGANITRGLQLAYVRLLGDPRLTDGDALRYTLYASMAVSLSRLHNYSMVARLLLDVAFGNESIPYASRGPVEAAVVPLGLPIYILGVALLAAANLLALIWFKS